MPTSLRKLSSLLRMALFVSVGVAGTGCTDALVFSESSGFNLSIGVNEEPSTPVQLNAGLERTVLAFAPPVKESNVENGQRRAEGEAVSLFSGFRLTDDHAQVGSSAFGGKLTIVTQFASGIAAQKLAGNTEAVRAVTSVAQSTYGVDGTTILIECWLDKDPSAREPRLAQWIEQQDHLENVGFGLFLSGSYASDRKRAIDELGVPGSCS